MRHSPFGDLEKRRCLARQDSDMSRPSNPHLKSKRHVTGLLVLEKLRGQGQGKTTQEIPPAGRTFQKLLEPPMGSELANSEAVRKLLPATLLSRNQHEETRQCIRK